MRWLVVALLLASCAAPPVAHVRAVVVVQPSVVPRVPVVRADRSRPLTAPQGPRWPALAMCESTDNPRAVSSSGRYRGLYQMDANFWRTYGGLRYASRPDLASRSAQTRVAQRGYQARGSRPWPICGRRL